MTVNPKLRVSGFYMSNFSTSNTKNGIEVQGLDSVLQSIDNLMLSNPKMEKQIHKIIKEVLMRAASKTRQSAISSMSSDPREAYRAVKSSVYKRIFGGNVNILASRRRSGKAASIPSQNPQTGRGGNRRKRSARTEQIMSYWGRDRSFILRFLNEGTAQRNIVTQNADRNGNRGSISARNWFQQASSGAVEQAAIEFTETIDKVIEEMWEGGTANS